MRFYGNGVVWDAQNDRPLARFVGGVFDTEEQRTTQLLIDSGYRRDTEAGAAAVPEKQVATVSPSTATSEPVSTDLNVQALRDLGRTHGISFKFGTTKEQMVAAINAAK